MTHSDAGNYAAKHKDQSIPSKLNEAISAALVDNRLSCSRAHQLAQDLGFTPIEVGRAADLMEVHLTGCQLGLFGHGKKEKVKTTTVTDPKLEKVLQENLYKGSLDCLKAWEIASEFNLKKTDLMTACDACEIKITPCQLGAF
ncbi:MAG: hypothetical protein KAI69_05555 [Deltaproteobacteria bacterium]|nr:hypothetical protein [Deltaproteobacteria bacterium]